MSISRDALNVHPVDMPIAKACPNACHAPLELICHQKVIPIQRVCLARPISSVQQGPPHAVLVPLDRIWWNLDQINVKPVRLGRPTLRAKYAPFAHEELMESF
jgi:hypothetical protein